MASANPRTTAKVFSRICINPTDLSLDFPHGGTALGMGAEIEFRPQHRDGLVTAQEFGGENIEVIEGAERAIVGAIMRGIDDDAFKGIEAIILSMTPEERENPTLLNGGRRKRIADGSGTSIQEVNRLIKQFDETRKLMKMMTGAKGKNLARMMGNMPKT